MNLIHYLDQLQELINTPSPNMTLINETLDILRTEFANQPEQSPNELTIPSHDQTKYTFVNPLVTSITANQSYVNNQTEFTITLISNSWRTSKW